MKSSIAKTIFDSVDLYFDEVKHKYYHPDCAEIISVTTAIGKFKNEISDNVKFKCAEREGITIHQLEAKWAKAAKDACDFGTIIHKEIEEFIVDGVIPSTLPLDIAIQIMNTINAYTASGYEFFSEQRLLLKDAGLAGTADAILINLEKKTLYVFDFKTNKKIETENTFHKFMKYPIFNIPDISLFHYTLQLSIYAYMIKNLFKDNGYPIERVKLCLYHITKEWELVKHPCIYIEDDVLRFLDGLGVHPNKQKK